MDIIFGSLITTGYGAALIGAFILIAILIEFFTNKPKT